MNNASSESEPISTGTVPVRAAHSTRPTAVMNFAALDPGRLRELFDAEGYVILKGVLETGVLREVQSEMEKLVEAHADKLSAAGKLPETFLQEPFETRLYRLYEGRFQEAPKSFR